MPSNSLPQVASSGHEPALPAFTALCDEALRRCSTQHGLPVTPSEEMRLRAWQLCWLALDAASAPANNLPETVDAQVLPVELIEQLRTSPLLPKLNAQSWQELRRARDQQLFAGLRLQEPCDAAPIADDVLASMLRDALGQLGLEQLRAWLTPRATAAIARWLSAGLLASDALALSDDTSDAGALELSVFVQARLHSLQGAVETAEDAARSEPARAAAVSDKPAIEAKREPEPAAAREPQPAASPAAAAVASPAAAPAVPEPSVSEVAAGPGAGEAAAAIEPPRSTSTADDSRVDAARAATPPRRLQPQAIAALAGAVAVAAALLFMLKPGAPQPDATPTAPAPSARVETPEPAMVQPIPEAPVTAPPSTPPTSKTSKGLAAQGTLNTQRPHYRNVAAAKRAHAAKKIDDAAYAAAIADLEAQRSAKLAKAQNDLHSGKLSQRDYQRKVDAINKSLGFDSP